MASKRKVGPARIREWAQETGQTVGSRGRFSQDLIDAFHAANKREVYSVGQKPVQEIKGIRVTESGRKVPVTVKASPSEVRAFALAQGLQVGARGRISAEVKAAFAATPR